jgi:glutathione S-transferase
MKLYSGPLSLFTGKVRVALAEKGIEYERVDVPFSRAGGYTPKHPDVLAINPKAQVPVLVDGDVAIYDSTIILEYLEERYPQPPLYPRDPGDRARCRQAEAAADEILFPNVLALIQEVFYKRDGERDRARVDGAHQAIAAHYRGLDQKLAGREYLCGPFSVADIGYLLTITFASGLGAAPSPELANLGGWMARVSARPAVGAELAGLSAAMTRT